MSEMAPEQGGVGGGFFASRFMGIPVVAWVIVVGVVAYYLISRSQGSQQSPAVTTAGGGGRASQSVRLSKGAVTIDVMGDHQPKPPVGGRRRQMVTIPDVVGKQYATGAKQITQEGLRVTKAKPFTGEITKEFPKAGKKVRKGSVVRVSGTNEKGQAQQT